MDNDICQMSYKEREMGIPKSVKDKANEFLEYCIQEKVSVTMITCCKINEDNDVLYTVCTNRDFGEEDKDKLFLVKRYLEGNGYKVKRKWL